MHEIHLINDLMKKITTLATDNQAKGISKVTVQLGALSHISGDHFREHFEEAAAGTIAEKAALEIIEAKDIHAPDAQDILLKDIEVY